MYTVVNNNTELDFTGKGETFTTSQALDLYDSLGGAEAGYKLEKTETVTYSELRTHGVECHCTFCNLQ